MHKQIDLLDEFKAIKDITDLLNINNFKTGENQKLIFEIDIYNGGEKDSTYTVENGHTEIFTSGSVHQIVRHLSAIIRNDNVISQAEQLLDEDNQKNSRNC